MMNRTHIHHIVPKHMGGTDDPSNLIELSIEDHAKAHEYLYKKYGLWQDKLAWKMLSGQIKASEASKLAQKIGAYLGAKLQPLSAKAKGGRNNTYENRVKAANARYIKYGHIHSNLSKESQKKYDDNKSIAGLIGGKKCHEKRVGAFETILCYECGKISTARWIKHHGKKTGHLVFGAI